MRKYLAILLVLVTLAGCALPGSSNSPTGQGTPTTPATAALPSYTATPGTPLTILVIPPDMPKKESDLYQSTVNDLAKGAGMRFQVRNSLTADDLALEPALKIVVAFPPDPGLADLASKATQVQFVGVTIPGLSPASNLSLVGGKGVPLDKQAFMAGYIAAILSTDFRVGIITQKDTPEGTLAYNAFLNGMHFYCGLCNPQFPPWYKYPVHSEIPTDVPEAQFRFYAEPLKNYMVDFAYVYPGVGTRDLFDYMSQVGLNIISQVRPADNLSAHWVVSIQPEVVPAIQALWPDLLAGKGGQDISLPLFLVEVNPDLLSPGKQADVQEILDRVQKGEIDTAVNP